VELKLPIRPDKKPVNQLPRMFALEIMSKIKEEIERLLKSKFIRTTRYVKWLANINPIIKIKWESHGLYRLQGFKKCYTKR